MRTVRTVTRVRSPLAALSRIPSMRSRIWFSVGLTRTRGSNSPVGRMICSTTRPECASSKGPGVAETKTTWETLSKNSSKRRGRLSNAEGRRKP